MSDVFQISIIFKKDWMQMFYEKNADPCETLLAHLRDKLFFVQMTKKSGDGCVFQVVGIDEEDVSNSLYIALGEMNARDGVKYKQINEIYELDTLPAPHNPYV